MSKSNMVSLEINEEMVRPVLEKQIQAAILANIGNPEELISKIVSKTLRQKVNRQGAVDSCSYRNEFDYLELLTSEEIRKTAKETLQGWLKENVQLVKKAVIEEMNKPERQASMVKAFADATERSLRTAWSFDCTIDFRKKDEY